MITRLLAAGFALYLVAGTPKLGDLPLVSMLTNTSATESGQAQLAKQALDFCLANRETCTNIASGMISSPTRTGAIAEAPKAAETQMLPLPAPELPLPPRRRGQSRSGA
ncbi:MAG: hypothetical protein ACRDBL_11470 [Rhabdaerophilum sp.]